MIRSRTLRPDLRESSLAPSSFTRRRFLHQLALGGLTLIAARSSRAADSRVEVFLEEPIAPISPNLLGHFTEHIGGVVYDGIWVGEDSKIPNQGGIRTALVEHMRRLKPPVVRWPGGCFADSYNWRDGIGPRSQRPRRTNFWINDSGLQHAPDGPQKYDPNRFGTNEFVRFCRLIGAQPYLAANVRSLTPRDFYEWVEYCNAPAGQTTLSDQRAANGDPDPFGVRYWGVGNESWGCGGNFTPEEYATEFRRFTAWVPDYGVRLAFIGSGPSGGDVDWTHRFFTKLTERDKGLLGLLHGWAMHYYCGTAGKGQAIDFTERDWFELLAKALQMESILQQQWTAMGEVDREHRVKLIIDEWGAWHRAGTEVHPAYLFGQTSTMRDALVAALTLDIFNRHADKVIMANVAQLINNLHSLFLAREDQFVATPNFYVFEGYAAHAGGQAVRTIFSAPDLHAPAGIKGSLPSLAGSASLHGRTLVLTVVNPHATEPRTFELAVRNASVKAGQVWTLAADDIHAHNSFEHPDRVRSAETDLKISGATPVCSVRPASVSRFTLELG